jgi:hypothetical protein
MNRTGKKKGPVVAKKVMYDGITFASGLEKYMYKALKDAGIEFKYEGYTYELVPSFTFVNNCVERQSNSKGDFINRGNKKVLNLKYTPDFVGIDFIIETKGRANESFPLRWKLFKKWMHDNNDERTLYKPQKISECDETIRLILLERNMRQEKNMPKDK